MKRPLAATIAFCGMLFAACLMAQDEDYKLGVLMSFTGAGAGYSQDGLKGVQLAVDEINAQGGLLGKTKIVLSVADSKTDAATAASEIAKLIGQGKVSCVISDYSSSCAQTVKKAARSAKVLHIASISNSEDITRLDFSPYTFSVVPNTYMQAKAVAIGIARMARLKGWKTYVTVASDYEWGRSTQRNFVKLLNEAAPELLLKADIWVKQGETNFNPFILAVAKERPDFIYTCLAASDNAGWLRASQDVKLFDKFTSVGSLVSVWELSRQKSEIKRGIFAVCRAPFFAHPDNKAMTSFVERYKAANDGAYPSDWAVMSYDAVMALKQGAEKAGSLDSSKIKDALGGAQIDTTRGAFKFRAIDNQLECPSYLGFVADDPKFPFPVYSDLVVVSGPETMRPEAEIAAAREERK